MDVSIVECIEYGLTSMGHFLDRALVFWNLNVGVDAVAGLQSLWVCSLKHVFLSGIECVFFHK